MDALRRDYKERPKAQRTPAYPPTHLLTTYRLPTLYCCTAADPTEGRASLLLLAMDMRSSGLHAMVLSASTMLTLEPRMSCLHAQVLKVWKCGEGEVSFFAPLAEAQEQSCV